jgi:hypothetical protein
MPDDPRDSPAGEIDRPRRPLRKWVQLLVVWTLGLVMWAVYLAGILYLLSRIL